MNCKSNKEKHFSGTARQQKWFIVCENKGNLQTRRWEYKVDKHVGLTATENRVPHMACRRLIERFGGPNCAVPSAQVTEPARHVTVSNRLTDEQMCAGVCMLVCVCVFKHVSLSLLCDHIFSSFFFFLRELRQEFLS